MCYKGLALIDNLVIKKEFNLKNNKHLIVFMIKFRNIIGLDNKEICIKYNNLFNNLTD